MKSSAKLTSILIGSLILLAAFSSALALTSPIITLRMPLMSSGTSGSYNWSGYAVTGAKGSVTSVSGSWTVPTLVTNTGTALAAIWVGIDGYSSNTVEQIGTLIATSSAQSTYRVPEYCAWYEFYPSPMYEITSLTINPGDNISATVTYTGSSSSRFGRSSSTFSATITDETTGGTYTITGTVANAARSSAEWIAEAPSSSSGILPLANFGTVGFGEDYTQVTGTCYATISGTNGPVGSFSSSAIQEITMVTSKGVNKAVPSALSFDETSFSITWISAGP